MHQIFKKAFKDFSYWNKMDSESDSESEKDEDLDRFISDFPEEIQIIKNSRN